MKSEIRLQNERPFGFFFAQHESRTVKELKISSPFLGQKSINRLTRFMKGKQTSVKLLINLSPMHLATSMDNPVTALIDLKNRSGERIEIRSNTDLHAKAILSDVAGIFGSSNFTTGGEERNAELNLYVCGSEKTAKNLLKQLHQQFTSYWDSAECVDLKEVAEDYENTYAKIAHSIARYIPNPNLGKDNYKKIRVAMGRKHWQAKDLGVKLTEGPLAKAGGYIPKIVFLQQLGLVKFDGKSVTRVDAKWDAIKDNPAAIFALITKKFTFFQEVLVAISKRTETKYAHLLDEFNFDEKSPQLVAVIRWLESLDYIKRQSKKLDTDRKHKFKIKPKGQQYLDSVKEASQ